MTALALAPQRSAAAADAHRAFTESFGSEPDGVFSAPGRVNIIGEHVDYQDGLCLPMAIEHRCFAAACRTDTGLLRLRSVQSTDQVEIPVAETVPGAVAGWAAYAAGVVWALREQLTDALGSLADAGLDIMIDGQVPLGAGLSSSAALECAVAAAVEDLFALGTTAHERITACIAAENDFVGAATGGLDQSASILATDGHALLLDCRDFSTESVPWDLAGQGLALLITDTHAPHSLVGGEYAQRRDQAEESARTLGVPTLRDASEAGLTPDVITDPLIQRRARHVLTEIHRTRAFAGLLEAGTVREHVAELGELMNASHTSLRDDFEVTVPELDTAVEAAKDAGAHGARMTGGGFGGSIIALVEADQAEHVARAIEEAFAERGFAAPQSFLALPSAGAGRDS